MPDDCKGCEALATSHDEVTEKLYDMEQERDEAREQLTDLVNAIYGL